MKFPEKRMNGRVLAFRSHGRCLFLFKILLLAAVCITAGRSKIKAQNGDWNLPAYTNATLHFGFILGINSTNFAVVPVANLSSRFNDTLKSIRSAPASGFNLGIVSELRLSRYLRLRFVPDLAFSQRNLDYSFAGADTFDVSKQVQSTFIDLPLDLKLISKRQHNFEAYVLAGGKFIMDLSSQQSVNQSLAAANATVRLIRNDYSYEVGAGIEFYLPYFKFGVEFKLSRGVRNLLVPDNTVYTQSLQALYSQVYLLSLTFEG
ncbi:MAG: PorT family protein [Bacteroidia bacterium]|nr:PorT family protein [Bacteroidia bacterium]